MVLAIILFVVTFATVLGVVGFAFAYLKSKQKQQFRSMLRNAEPVHKGSRNQQLLRPAEVEDTLSKLLRRFQVMARLNATLEQSGIGWTTSKLAGMSGMTFLLGLLVGWKFLHILYSPQLSGAVLGFLGGICPLLLVLRKRSKALAAFEEQFPEALDFISRSMRAGHGFSTALEMLAADSPEPLGTAFRKVSNDIQLGSSLESALRKLVNSVPLVDVRFFVSSVLLQQETGGNLGEILSKLSYVIRERFRLKGQVKAVSAHGRITGLVLLLMPIGVTLFIMATNPEYLTTMFAQKIGKILVYGAGVGQVLAYFAIKKITNIKV